MKILELENEPLSKLLGMAKTLNIPGYNRMKKESLAMMIREAEAQKEGIELRGGILEIMSEGIGFLRATNYRISDQDVYVSQAQLRKYDLRAGDLVIGQVRPPRESERHFGLLKVESINGLEPDAGSTRRVVFENLTPIFPEVRFDLEIEHDTLAPRLINLIAPIGRGQRGLIVSPPKAGKTTILKQIANSISTKYPDVHLIIALIGERPEEVTDMDRSVDAEVVASTFDEPVTAHVRTAELALERAKRLVEIGRHVVILMDSITRLARAYNLVVNPSGRTLSGQTAEAFWNSLCHAEPFSFGFNCALGAKDLRQHVAEIAAKADCLVSAHANAGMPNAFGEYDETPTQMAEAMREWAQTGLINIVGGC